MLYQRFYLKSRHNGVTSFKGDKRNRSFGPTHMTEDSIKSTFTDRFLNSCPLENLIPGEGIDLMLRFYGDEPVDGLANGDTADMLLFQWGVFDWGHGESFEFDITRQLIFGDGEDDDIFQLSLTFRFVPTDELRNLPKGNRWCSSRAELEDFRHFVLRSAPYAALNKKLASSVDLHYGCAG
jgi:hypothetical protein